MTKHPKSKRIESPRKQAKSRVISFAEKFVTSTRSPIVAKEAVSFPFVSRMDRYAKWDDERKDILDAWSWGQVRDWTGRLWGETILPFSNSCEQKKWYELESERAGSDHRHKIYPIAAICKEAKDRLLEIKLDDMEDIFRFRLGNKPRLYGFIIQHIFFVVWWDGDHRICPSDIQNRGKVRR